MLKNLNLTRGLVYSEKVMLRLVEKGMSRSEAYDLVQSLALRCWKTQEDFKTLVAQNVPFLTSKDLEEIFDPNHFLKNVDRIFSRFEGE
jgi:adenylosuccinate lyase